MGHLPSGVDTETDGRRPPDEVAETPAPVVDEPGTGAASDDSDTTR